MVVASILLAYALAQLIDLPLNIIPISIGGIYIPVNLNFTTLIAFAVAIMTASGTDWILRDHPELKTKPTYPHLLLPAMTAWVLNVILNNTADTPVKWIIFLIGGLFLLTVILFEYIAVSPEDLRRPLAIATLTALAYALFLALAVSLVSAQQRLVIALPAIALGAGALSMRVIQLQTLSAWSPAQTVVCTLVSVQIAAALHYLPVAPISYGVLLLATLYSIITLITSLEHGSTLIQAIFEAGVPFFLLVGVALWLN